MTGEWPWRTAWITGGSSGIGLETARLLAMNGMTVAVSARKPPPDPLPPKATFYPVDVTDAAQMANCAVEIEKAIGPIDLCIFGAGAYAPFSLEDFSLDEFRRINDVNYLGVLNGIAAILPHMRARGKGHLSWIASVAGYRGLPKAAYYGPTKAALTNLAESLKLELAPAGINVSVINPGFVATPMTSVNDFKMPFLMTPQAAARATITGLAKGKFEVAYPKRFAMLLKLMRILPYNLYFRLARLVRQP